MNINILLAFIVRSEDKSTSVATLRLIKQFKELFMRFMNIKATSSCVQLRASCVRFVIVWSWVQILVQAVIGKITTLLLTGFECYITARYGALVQFRHRVMVVFFICFG